ncbi:hypothetical protein ACWA2B_10610 [Paenibacillus sp. CMM36]
MKIMSEQTLEEFKNEIIKQAIELHGIKSLEETTLDYVFKQAHIRGQWAERKGIID